jgi:WXXGXW repeat (2 copies)
MRELTHFRTIRLLFLAISMLLLPSLFLAPAASAEIGISVSFAPPELPIYDQPICPGDGYIWTPGYWAWDGEYYWVPGTWVMAPEVGFLWTPGYWGWGGNGFLFYDGYWGPTIGFYGGINYGYGYFGHGYEGGRWDRGHFYYNTSVNHIDEHSIHNVYNTRVNENSGNHVSFNGGNGGINERANSQEEAAAHERHMPPQGAQQQHAYAAHNNPQQRFSANHGTPLVSATPRPNMASHPKELPPIEHSANPNTGNAKMDQKYQKQQESVFAKQNQQRQNLQQKQDNQHQQLTRQNAPPQRMQQMEQQHQQQTQQMQQKHTQQTQQMQQRQQPSGGGASHGNGHR